MALRLVSGPEGQCHARSGQVRVRLAFTIVSHLKGRAHWQAVGHRFIRQQLADSSLSTPAFCILASHTGIQVRRRSAPSLPFSVPGATVRAAAGHCKIKVSNHPPRSGPDYPRAHMWGPPGSQGLRRLQGHIEARAGLGSCLRGSTARALFHGNCQCVVAHPGRHLTSCAKGSPKSAPQTQRRCLFLVATSSLHIENIHIRSNTRTEPEAHKKCPHDPICVSCKVK